MYEIFEKNTVVRKLRRHAIPEQVFERYQAWKAIAMAEGVAGLRKIKGFHDEQWKGELKNMRSSRLGNQWRVLYEVEADVLYIYVIDIDAHDYRRKK